MQGNHPAPGLVTDLCRMDSYFAYVGDKLDIRPHCRFDTVLKRAYWDDQLHLWHIIAEGKEGLYRASARYLILCIVRVLFHVIIHHREHCASD